MTASLPARMQEKQHVCSTWQTLIQVMLEQVAATTYAKPLPSQGKT
jgi:hypothetical protein